MRISRKGATALLVLFLSIAIDSTDASLTDRASHVPPNHNTMLPPAVGESYVDPVFNETVWRLTDVLAGGESKSLTTEYSSQSPTNANDSMVRVMPSNGGVHFYSTRPPFRHLRTVRLAATSPSDFWWHPTNPNILYHLAFNGEFRAYNYAADQDSVVARFPYNNVAALGENQLSLDGNRLAAVANDGTEIFVYELSTDTIIARFDASSLRVGDLTMSPDGTRVVVHHNPGGGPGSMHVYGIGNGTLNFERNLGQGYGHKDVGQSPSGEDYLLAVESWFDNIVRAVRLSDGAVTTLLPLRWTPPSNIALHVSANSMVNDGWVYISTYLLGEEAPGATWPAYANEVLRVQFDGSVVERLAHTRSRYDRDAGDTYYSSPRAAVSRSGKYLFWASSFRRRVREPDTPADYADTYMMETPPPPLLPPPAALPPAAPSSLRTVASPGNGTIALGKPGGSVFFRSRTWATVGLSWNDNSDDEDSFRIFRKSSSEDYEFIAAVDADKRTFKDAVEPGSRYCFRVFASNGAGSSPSNESCADVD